MTDPDTPIRAFIAVGVSLEARTELENAIQRLDAQAPTGIRWVKPSGLHLTLKFLGDVSPQNLPEIIHAVGQSAAESPALLIHLSGLGVFPNERNPRVLRAGVEGDLEALANLQEKIEDAIVSLGFPRERRPFSPHLTLGRVRDHASQGQRRLVGALMSSMTLEHTESWLVSSVQLIHSTLTPEGAVYSTLSSAPMQGTEDTGR